METSATSPPVVVPGPPQTAPIPDITPAWTPRPEILTPERLCPSQKDRLTRRIGGD